MSETALLSKDKVEEFSENTGWLEGEIKRALEIKENKQNLRKQIENITTVADAKNLAMKVEYGSEELELLFKKWLGIFDKVSTGPVWWKIREIDDLCSWAPEDSELERKAIKARDQACIEQLEHESDFNQCVQLYEYTSYGSEARKKIIQKTAELFRQLTEFNC